MKVTTTTERDAVAISYEGETYYTEREVVRVEDWVELRLPDGTVLPFNRGFVHLGKPRWVPCDPRPLLSLPRRRWWQFWR